MRLVIPAATIVAHGELQLQVTLPDHPGDVVHLPLVDEHFQPLVEIHPHIPEVHPGQVWRGADGALLFAIRYQRDDSDPGDTLLIAVNGGLLYGPALAVEEFGPLTLLDERPAFDEAWFGLAGDDPMTYDRGHDAPTGEPVPAGVDGFAVGARRPTSQAGPAADDTAVLPRVPIQEGTTR
ncbi:hypothetical protein [Micromonospora sp. CB01531]|uniref:hypothetical protein n=1 Tax=Micromonospora sp. CB01531 TaxID=1718947 RepID=UPI000939E02B|nr:hypothetical protein [Micromonospora sp. CB01531]OKI52874.1 hypothetical protein A6A27_08275 [Micromonospora sp. CB01531]